MSRDRRITFCDLHFGDAKKPFRDAITQNKEFRFGTKDIRRLRDEMGVLIDRLGELYKVWKRKTEAEAEEKEADNQDLTPDAEVLAETVVAEKVAETTEFKSADGKDGTENKRIKVEADQAEEAETAEEKHEQTKRIKVESDQAETAIENADEMEDVQVETVAEKATAKRDDAHQTKNSRWKP